MAQSIGYPVMLKASAGGGGRGMRVVTGPRRWTRPSRAARARPRRRSAIAAVFLEKIVPRPRHIEVQVLGDGQGNVVHLFERDCSVQRRHQKVVEVAPAPASTTACASASSPTPSRSRAPRGYENAGTVEFLVDPETGQHFFIECNPRIQVEHTITEQVMGLDLVEAQFRIAAGASLGALGLADQKAVGTPRGFAIQARVVAQGTGTLTAYREPSGPGRAGRCLRLSRAGAAAAVRSPARQADLPVGLLGHLRLGGRPHARALDEFHIAGVPTNASSCAPSWPIPSSAPAMRARPCWRRRSNPRRPSRRALKFLDQQAGALGRGRGAASAAACPAPLPVPPGHEAIESPHAGSVVDIKAREGDKVKAGDLLFVVSAMKMETSVTAPCAGIVTALAPLAVGDSVDGGQILAVIKPAAGAAKAAAPACGGRQLDADAGQGRGAAGDRPQAAGARLERARRGAPAQPPQAHLPRAHRRCCSTPAASARSAAWRASPRFDEDGDVAEFTPASHVGGQGRIEGRPCIVCADDFTSRGGHADGAIGQKSRYLDRLSIELRTPSIRLLDGSSGGGSVATMVPKQDGGGAAAKESTGAIKAGRPRVVGGGGSFLPGHLGSTYYTEQLATVPVVNLLLGSVVGIGAAKAVLGHFSVMVRDISQLFVAGPPVVSHAMGYDVTKEDLGGWHIHCRNGSVDNLAETEEEAMAQTRRFLSYLPSSVYEAPPVGDDPTDPADRREEELLTLVPRKRTATFDVRRAIRLMADKDSFFEIGPLWGTDQVTGFVRMAGYPMGVIASDSRHVNGGALTADGCDKLKRHLDVCDLFHLPVLNLVDNPGFAVGIEHEIAGTIRKGGEWMVAFAQVTVPIFTVLMRRSFGVAGNNYATPRSAAVGARGLAGGRCRRHPARGRHRGGLQAPARRSGRSRRAARRDQRPHRERARPDRPAQPLRDRGDDRPARHAPARLRMDGRCLAHRQPAVAAGAAARCSSGLSPWTGVCAVSAVSATPSVPAPISRTGCHGRAAPARAVSRSHTDRMNDA